MDITNIETVERLENIVYRYNRESRGWHDCNDIRLNSSDIKAIEKVIELIKSILSAEPKWIPVSMRLPEEDGQYLITVKYKHVNNSYEDVYAEYGEWYDGRWDMSCFGHCGEVEDVIAWMPLPEPYQPHESEANNG